MSAIAFLFPRPLIRPAERSNSSIHDLARRRIRQLLRPTKLASLKEEAVEVLQSQSSTLDHCEWAERFLCGMTSADATGFLEHRRSQS
jgi:hypothetical protein